jgi:hypothetical protein
MGRLLKKKKTDRDLILHGFFILNKEEKNRGIKLKNLDRANCQNTKWKEWKYKTNRRGGDGKNGVCVVDSI